MSASEKLKALDATMTEGPWYATVNDLIGGVLVSNVDKPASAIDTRSREGNADRVVADLFNRDEDAQTYVALRNALPQIVAVVEAAEFARSWARMPSDLRWEEFDAALAALDEALT